MTEAEPDPIPDVLSFMKVKLDNSGIFMSGMYIVHVQVPSLRPGYGWFLCKSLTHSWSSALLDKLPVVQLLQELPSIL
jgi:hypothetical protein